MTTQTLTPTISIRAASSADGPALTRLAALDSAPAPFGPALIAEVDGEPRAVLSLHDGAVVADPFFPTVHLVELLRLHAAAAAPAPQGAQRLRLRFA